ncbi:hypothetical protein [Agriterribacter sp.]|uniref:hypothetical protein n=1 Tax=Agriterribacter sp. TaxID=2821509 RepID=UPI002B9695D2|nr:hypothetical protein [Agriterribacter sp.]HTN05699.1 hypothetical protein [Agriterribacter sp.]
MSEEFFKIDFSSLSVKFELELNYFKEYISFNSEQLNRRHDELQKMMQTEVSDFPENKMIIEAIYAEEALILPSYFFHSSIVALYSLLENNLNEICNVIIKETAFAFSISDLGDRNILKRARIFLDKLTNIEFIKIDKSWIKITSIQKLRNLIVHQNAKTKELKNDIADIIFSYGTTREDIDGLRFYIHKSQLLDEFLAAIEQMIKEIIDQLSRSNFQRFNKATPTDAWGYGLPNDLPF